MLSRRSSGNCSIFSSFAHFRSCSYASASSTAEFEKLVQTRCKSRDLSIGEALRLFNDMSDMRPMPSVRSFNQLIDSMSKMNQFSTMVSMYSHLVRFRWSDFEPNICTLNIVAKCLWRSNSAKSGFAVLSVAIKSGLGPDSFTMNTLLDGLCKEGLMATAMKLFEKMVDHKCLCDEVPYGTIINGFCKAGETQKAISLLKRIVNFEGIKKDCW